MAKFHINSKGVPAPCRATKGNCPFGSEDSHFDNIEDAQVAADEANEKLNNFLPATEPEPTLREKMDEAKNSEVDLSANLPRIELTLNQGFNRLGDWSHKIIERDYFNKSDEEYSETLLKEHNIKLTDLEDTTEEQRRALGAILRHNTSRKTGNIAGFMNSDRNTSYSQTKEYSKATVEGSYAEISTNFKMLSRVGWHKTSAQGANDENTRLNKMMDKESLRIAGEISNFSPENQESRNYPASGLIGSVQALRLRGWNEKQIKNVAVGNKLSDVVYEEYKVKPRDVSGATEMERVMNREVDNSVSGNTLQSTLAERLGWTE